MRRPSVYLDRREQLDVAMTPMIDVVFLLLVFFVWTASFQIVEYVLPTPVARTAGSQPADPQTPPPPEADFQQLVIHVLPGPVWELNGQTIGSPQQLGERLAAVARVRQSTPAIIHPREQAPLGAAVDAFDAALAAGLTKVAFAVPSS